MPTPVATQTPVSLSCAAVEIDGRLVHGEASPLVQIDPQCGRLSYGYYANEGQTEKVNLVPDFSYAGYMGGGVGIPAVQTLITLEHQDGDNRARIQAAIDEVANLDANANGVRGAILLRAGEWEVSDTLTISAGGVVLRGEGPGDGGTTLLATQNAQHDLIRIQGSGSGLGEISGTEVNIASDYVPVGAKSFDVADTANFSEGDSIGLRRTPNQFWLDATGMSQWGWTTSAYTIDHERKITDIDGNTITIDIPVVDTLQSAYGGGSVFLANLSGRIAQTGVENLRMVSSYSGDEDEAHGWNAIVFSRVENSWVRQVTVEHFGFSAVSLTNNSSFNTVEEVAFIDPKSIITGGRRYAFYVASGTGNLFQRCFAREGRHNFVSGSRVTGPNVWLDSSAVQSNSDDGPHHRWATGLLFDNLSAASFRTQNREDSGSGHGWAGAQTMFWNIEAASQIVADAPEGAMNWSVGAIGPIVEGFWAPEAPPGIFESHDMHVLPRSLYLAQLEDRLGSDAVNAITTEQQRAGDIWGLLNGWAGEGYLENATPVEPVECDGILSGSVCCHSACGQCGGSGCGSLPGGASACCSTNILNDNLSCETNPAPCVMW